MSVDLKAATRFVREATEKTMRRNGKGPAWLHPLRVAAIIEHRFGRHDPYTLAIGLLHDIIEDTPFGFFDIQERFGPAVAQGVLIQTYVDVSDEAESNPQKRRIHKYRTKMRGVPHWDLKSCLVSFADILDNLFDNNGERDIEAHDPYRSFMLEQMLPEIERRLCEFTSWSGPFPSQLISPDWRYLGERPILSEAVCAALTLIPPEP